MSLAAVYVETLEHASFVSAASALDHTRGQVKCMAPASRDALAVAAARAGISASALIVALHAASLPDDERNEVDRAFCEEAQSRLARDIVEAEHGRAQWPSGCMPVPASQQEALLGWRHLLLDAGCQALAAYLGGMQLAPTLRAAMAYGLHDGRLGWLDAYVLYLMAELRASSTLLAAFAADPPRAVVWLGLEPGRLRDLLTAAGTRMARAFDALRSPSEDSRSWLDRATVRKRPASGFISRREHLDELALTIAARQGRSAATLLPSASRIAGRSDLSLALAETAMLVAADRQSALMRLLAESDVTDADASSPAATALSALAGGDLARAGSVLAGWHAGRLAALSSTGSDPLSESGLLRSTEALAIVRELALGPAAAGLVYAETLQRLPASTSVGGRLTLDLLDAYVRCGVLEREPSAIEYALRVADFCLDPGGPQLGIGSRLAVTVARARLVLASPQAQRDQLSQVADNLQAILQEAPADLDADIASRAREVLGELQISWVGEPGGAKWLEKAVQNFRAAAERPGTARTSHEIAVLRRRLCDALTRQARVTRNASLAAEAVLEGTLALQHFDRAEGSLTWAQLCFAVGCAHQATSDLGSPQHEDALVALDRALAIYEALGLQDDWLDVQRRRGDLLLATGKRRKSPSRLALAVIAREEMILASAGNADGMPTAKAKLAESLIAFAEVSGTSGALRVAAAALDEAITATSASEQAWSRAALQQSLGEALLSLGTREDDIAALRQGMHVLDLALSARTRQKHPLPWVATVNVRSNIAMALALRTNDRELMTLALTAQKDALDVATSKASTHYMYVVRRDLQRNQEIEASAVASRPLEAPTARGHP
ncbi:MAG: hypothetical protein SFW09_17315 [Hyphomicrobiaceae bacterium]|nr:hypothetical protein [Hyphomicrobiaceae bacterium]